MKNIIKYICLTLSLGVFLTSCEDSENYTGDSVLKFTDVEVTLTTTQPSFAINESLIDEDVESTYTIVISASIPKAQAVDAIITFVQTSGVANANDYSVGKLKIAAGQTSGSANVEVYKTGDVEGVEDFNLEAVIADGNFKINGFNLPVTIENDYINGDLEFSTTWKKDFTFDFGYGTATVDACDMDFDVLVYSTTGVYMGNLGATGACTETGTLSGLPDGDYYIVVDLYKNDLTAYGDTTTVPVTVSYNQEYFGKGEFTSTAFNLGSAEGTQEAVAIVTVSGYNYTVTPQ